MFGAGHVQDMINRIKDNDHQNKRRGQYLKSRPLYKDIRKKAIKEREGRMSAEDLAEFGRRIKVKQDKILRRNITIIAILIVMIGVSISLLFVHTDLTEGLTQ